MSKILNRGVKVDLIRQLKNNKSLNQQVRIAIEGQFKQKKDKLMDEFQKHPVTRELKAGSQSSNITNSLSGGNLFGFIGFEEGGDPVSAIELALNKTAILIKQRKFGSFGLVWTYLVTSPSMKDLYSATPLPWARGSSWLRELEGRGIPNLGQYMFKRSSSSSRSGAGIQNTKKSRGGRLKIPYVKELLMKFENDLNSIDASRVSRSNF
jgi:hypothetical protein